MATSMAEPKQKTRRAPGAGRPKAEDPKEPLASFRGSAAFRDWWKGLLQTTRLPAATLLELAVIEYAEKHGYAPKPPER